METVGTICEGEWSSSFNGICEEADFMAQLLGNYAHPNASFWAADESSYKDASGEESSVYSSEEINASIFSFSLGNNSITFPSSSYSFANNNGLMAMDYGKNSVVAGHDFLNREDSVDSDDKMQVDVLQESFKEEKISSPSEISKKRPQIPSGSQRSKRIKKSAKADENDESNNTTSGCSSEDDSINASNEANGVKSGSSSKRSGAENIKGKARASRGSATDPQSLYARKRRERINERLRVLQTLVPNGTKVDISTMLEEAVIYVKFLQLQIKLLSSDDLWMYAPIAYNGMDLGLDFKNTPSPTPQSS